WIATEYNNQNNPSSFYNIGNEESVDVAPVISNENPVDGAVDVPISLSLLQFYLFDFQNDLMEYTVTAIPDIIGGPQSGSDINSGTTVNIQILDNPLDYDTLYTWNINVTDGIHWTNETFYFNTESEPEPWQYRKEITIDHTKVTADLTNFPVLIHITDADLVSKAQNDGDDILFTDKIGNKLNHEKEYYNGATGELIAWVNIPSLSSTQDTELYLYYGNPACENQENAAGTWDNNFLAVHHLAETIGTAYDSTVNNNDGVPYGNPNQNIGGIIGDADYFDGTNDHLTLPQVYSTENQFSLEAWIYPQTGARYFISQWSNNKGVFLQVGATPNRIEWYIDGISGSISGITLDTWYNIVLTYDGTTARIYRNAGTPTSKTCNAPIWPAEGMYIGDRSAGSRQFHGIIDEVRVSNIARSFAWIATEYNNQNNPSSFYNIGNEEPIISAPIVTNENPLNGAVDVPVSLSSLRFDLVDFQNDLMTYTVTTTPDIIGGPQSNFDINSGTTVSIPIIQTPLHHTTTYTWFVHVTDGTYWTNNTYSFTTSENVNPVISDVHPNNQTAP
ncbi:MAG: DUF2341 domain-containing protein, partial [Euryarchaeota archaeon]|nr:DUF2341 domain-containing protein [Euryarchaeota archaeon]